AEKEKKTAITAVFSFPSVLAGTSGKLISLYDTSATEQPDHALFSVGLQSETGDKCNIKPSFCVPLRGAVPPV
ncbi:hypothetical protein, partial [Chimaeribacter arupi]|uniref:hypothetical protein n=2 Tax=Chimaeribacter arupi TaxID=2060066 RepID=UPI0019D4A2FD